jgi:hypothetical protein
LNVNSLTFLSIKRKIMYKTKTNVTIKGSEREKVKQNQKERQEEMEALRLAVKILMKGDNSGLNIKMSETVTSILKRNANDKCQWQMHSKMLHAYLVRIT